MAEPTTTSSPGSANEVAIVSAREFTARVDAGETQAEAALATGTDATDVAVRRRRAKVTARAKELASLDKKEQRQLLAGRMLDIMIDGEDKDAIAAARVLTGDPDLGFQQVGATGIVISAEVLALPGSMVFKVTQVESQASKELREAEVIDVTEESSSSS